MAFHASILSQVLRNVKKSEFQNQVSKYNGDHRTRSVNCYALLVIMIYAQLKGHASLRQTVLGLGMIVRQFYHLGLSSVKRSTISDAMKIRSYRIYEQYFFQHLRSLSRSERRKFGKRLHLIDSSTISLCLNTHRWAKFRKTKAGIKLHTMYDPDDGVPEFVYITNAKRHDIKAIKDVIEFQPGEVYVYDRAYCSYKYLYSIELQGAFFVTRLKSNWKVRVKKRLTVPAGSSIRKDQLISVDGMKAKEYPRTLRLITFYHAETKKVFQFLTNNFEMSAEEIAEVYKTRWQIELFFKWMKQHLKIKSYLSTTENGIRIQIWCAMIAFLLLREIHNKVVNNIDFFHMLLRIEACLDKRIELYELLTSEIVGGIPREKALKIHQQELPFAS